MKPAFLLIDVQVNQFVHPYAVEGGEALLARVGDLLERARAAGAPVILVRNCGGPGDPDVQGSPGWELHPAIKPREGERILDKTTNDTFESTALETELRSRNVTDLVIAGVQSDWCIKATTKGAVARGYPVTLVSDAHSTMFQGGKPPAEIIAAINDELAPLVSLVRASDVNFTAGPRGV